MIGLQAAYDCVLLIVVTKKVLLHAMSFLIRFSSAAHGAERVHGGEQAPLRLYEWNLICVLCYGRSVLSVIVSMMARVCVRDGGTATEQALAKALSLSELVYAKMNEMTTPPACTFVFVTVSWKA